MSDGLKLLSLIIEHSSADTLRDLDSSVLVEEELEVYRFIRSHYRRYGRMPALATVEEDTGIDIPEAEEDAEYYKKKVYDRDTYNRLRGHYNSLKESLRSYDMDSAREIVDDMRVVTRVRAVDNSLLTIGEASTAVMQRYEFAHANPGLSGVPSGWASFDAITGGYQGGDLVVYVARPEMGKTNALLYNAYQAYMAGKSVLVISMEMVLVQMARRIMGFATGIDPKLITHGALSTYARRRLEAAVGEVAGADGFHLYSGGTKKKSGDVEILIQELQPDAVYIDGLYFMVPDSYKGMNKAERVDQVTTDLKAMAMDSDRPIIATSQLNRMSGRKGKEGSLETIAYSDAISTHASIVVKLTEGVAGHETDTRQLEIIKGREGETGIVPFWYKFRPVCFDEYTEQLDGEYEAEGSNLDWVV